jgi:hypothetical protein
MIALSHTAEITAGWEFHPAPKENRCIALLSYCPAMTLIARKSRLYANCAQNHPAGIEENCLDQIIALENCYCNVFFLKADEMMRRIACCRSNVEAPLKLVGISSTIRKALYKQGRNSQWQKKEASSWKTARKY